MKSMIPCPEQLREDLIDELESFFEEDEAGNQFKQFFDQITGKLTDEQRAMIDADRHQMAEARTSSNKFYQSSLTTATLSLVNAAMAEPEKFQFFYLPPRVGEMFQRLDDAGADAYSLDEENPVGSISVFACPGCRIQFCLLQQDVDTLLKACPFCEMFNHGQ